MNDAVDELLGALLREDAPPASDARFRIALVERRQRQLYRQQVWRRTLTFALMAVLPALLLYVADQPLVTALLMAASGGMVVSGMRAIGAMRHAWRWAAGSATAQRFR